MTSEHTAELGGPPQPPSRFARNFWILALALLGIGQMAVVFTWGTKAPGPSLIDLGDFLLNFLCIWLVLRAARRSTQIARYFWYVVAVSLSLFCTAAFINFYVHATHPSPALEDLAILISVFWFCPASLTLFLESDFEPRRFDPIYILDFIQIVLLWVVIYFFFLYMPSHEASESVFARSAWLHETWVGTLMYDGAMAAIFLLRSVLTNSPVVRALFGRIGIFLVLVCAGDFYYNYLGATLQAGSWYETIWTFLNICPIVIAATWDQEKVEKVPGRKLFGGLAGNRLFPILFGFIVLFLSLYIARERTLFALVIVGISFSASSLRLVIAQQRQDRVQSALQAEIVERQRVEQMLRQNEEHLGELVAERTVKLEESLHQLRQAQKMEAIGRLAGGIAHDFNNLLTVIRGYSRLLLDRATGHEFRAGLERIDEAADRAAALTSQLLAFSRRQVLQPKVFNLNELVQNLEKMLRRLVAENIEMRTVLAPDLGAVRADRSQIEQVVMNLVVNAGDAMPKGGKLTLETSNVYLDEAYAQRHQTVQPGRYILFAVTDTGTGIDPENLSHIFEPFFTTKEFGKGTGLGLSMVYGIVKQSGGNIWVYSEPGRGTSFKIYLPLVNAEIDSHAAGPFANANSRGTETILLVEDDEQVRELAREALSASGYNVLVAETPDTAISLCHSHKARIDLLLTDVVMPRISGPELAAQLTRIRPELKVLYMSGYTAQAIVHHGELDANTFFLQKPFTPSSLSAKVREVLNAATLAQPVPGSPS